MGRRRLSQRIAGIAGTVLNFHQHCRELVISRRMQFACKLLENRKKQRKTVLTRQSGDPSIKEFFTCECAFPGWKIRGTGRRVNPTPSPFFFRTGLEQNQAKKTRRSSGDDFLRRPFPPLSATEAESVIIRIPEVSSGRAMKSGPDSFALSPAHDLR